MSQGGSQPVSFGLTFVPGGDDLVDAVEHVGAQRALERRELALELLHRARADDRRGDGGVAR